MLTQEEIKPEGRLARRRGSRAQIVQKFDRSRSAQPGCELVPRISPVRPTTESVAHHQPSRRLMRWQRSPIVPASQRSRQFAGAPSSGLHADHECACDRPDHRISGMARRNPSCQMPGRAMHRPQRFKPGEVKGDGGGGRNRTGIDGFAGRCITTLPPRRVISAAMEPMRIVRKSSGPCRQAPDVVGMRTKKGSCASLD